MQTGVFEAMPLTIIDLKYMCDDMIQKGYGEKAVLHRRKRLHPA